MIIIALMTNLNGEMLGLDSASGGSGWDLFFIFFVLKITQGSKTNSYVQGEIRRVAVVPVPIAQISQREPKVGQRIIIIIISRPAWILASELTYTFALLQKSTIDLLAIVTSVGERQSFTSKAGKVCAFFCPPPFRRRVILTFLLF